MSYVRSWARSLFFAPLVLLSFSYPAYAAGSYSQTFDSDPPAAWVEAVDTWSATGGYYANTSTAPFRSIAYFGERRWTTDFTYSLQMYSDLRGTGNHKVGAVFNYVDAQNYLEVAIDMRGDEPLSQNVVLNQVSGGVRTQLLTGHSAIPILDTPFDVEIVRTGSNTVRVHIGNEDVLEYTQLASPPAGYLGVLTQYNWGRFDDVKVTPVIFRSGFGADLTDLTVTNPPACVGTKYQLNLTGTENANGTQWPPTFWGAPTVALMNTILDCVNPASYLDARIKAAVLHNDQSNVVLTNTVTNVTPNASDGQMARLGLSYTVGAEGNAPNRFYVRRYLRYSSEWLNEVPHIPTDSKWFVQHEFKNTTCDEQNPPRRLILYWRVTSAGEPYYQLKMDKSNSFPGCNPQDPFESPPDFPEQTCYPRRGGPCPEVITGQWFYDEYFVQYSSNGTSQDRVAYAINGQVIFNVPGPVRSSKARGIKLTPGYLNVPNVEVEVDDLEIYHDAPCRTFPCGAPSHY
jgi:hypothetical protein